MIKLTSDLNVMLVVCGLEWQRWIIATQPVAIEQYSSGTENTFLRKRRKLWHKNIHWGTIGFSIFQLSKVIFERRNTFFLERQANANIVMGKKRHFPVAKPKQSDQIKKKNNDKTKKVQKVLRKIAEKGKDELRKAAVKMIQKIKQDIPKQIYKIKTNDEPESTTLKPEITVDEKAVPKDKEDDSEESGDESKVASEDNDESDTDSDDDDSSGDEDSEVCVKHAKAVNTLRASRDC